MALIVNLLARKFPMLQHIVKQTWHEHCVSAVEQFIREISKQEASYAE